MSITFFYDFLKTADLACKRIKVNIWTLYGFLFQVERTTGSWDVDLNESWARSIHKSPIFTVFTKKDEDKGFEWKLVQEDRKLIRLKKKVDFPALEGSSTIRRDWQKTMLRAIFNVFVPGILLSSGRSWCLCFKQELVGSVIWSCTDDDLIIHVTKDSQRVNIPPWYPREASESWICTPYQKWHRQRNLRCENGH